MKKLEKGDIRLKNRFLQTNNMHPTVYGDSSKPTFKELRQHAKEMRLKRKEQLKCGQTKKSRDKAPA